MPITSMSSDKIYALLGTIKSDDEEDMENLMNDSDTEFIDETLVALKVIFRFQQAVWILKTI